MKKLLLSLFLLAFGMSSNAQAPGGVRWYNHYALIDLIFNNTLKNNEYLLPIWQDSTVLEKTGTTYQAIRYSSLYNVVDPISSKLFNDPSFISEIRILYYDAYTVDSVAIYGSYIRMPNQPANQVDTLIFSVIPINAYNKSTRVTNNKTQQPNVSWYTQKDSIIAYHPYLIDSNNLAAFADTNATSPKRALLKIPLTAQDGDTIFNGKLPAPHFFVYGLDTPLNIGAGDIFAVTVSFKSGGTWVKNTTPIDSLHRFMPVVSYDKPDTAMPYYYETFNERTTHGLMRANSFEYTPSIFMEANSTPRFKEEFIHLGALVRCITCWGNVENIPYNNTNLSVYPNPATDKVIFKQKKNISKTYAITITNSVGSKVAELNMTKKTTWHTNNIPSGLYFYQLRDDNKILATGKVCLIK